MGLYIFPIAIWLIMISACQTGQGESRVAVFTRASLDFRGFRPSLEEMETVEKSDRKLSKALDFLVENADFGKQYAGQMAGVWKTEVVEFDHTEHQYAFSDSQEILTLLTALGQEPLKVLEEIANTDLPYSEMVTGNWTMANADLAAWTPVQYDFNSDKDWQKVQYTDDRPSAGILVNNGLWWRYNSTLSNAQRGRANIISNLLLCNNFLDRRILIDRELNLLDEAGVQEAIVSNPTCVSCHVDLDPLASNLWGLYRHFRFSLEEQFSYHPERELHWMTTTGTPPGYFGSPISSLGDLGHSIAEDPALYTCLVERTWSQMNQMQLENVHRKSFQKHMAVFAESEFTIRPLVRSILNDPLYRDMANLKVVSARMYASQVEHLTQYRFQETGVDGFDADLYGIRGLFGGRGKDWSMNPSNLPTATFALVVQRIAEAAAYHATHNVSAANQFFTFDFQLYENATPDKFRMIYHSVLSTDPSDTELNDLIDLWNRVFELTESSAESWQAVLTYLFRHPMFLTY